MKHGKCLILLVFILFVLSTGFFFLRVGRGALMWQQGRIRRLGLHPYTLCVTLSRAPSLPPSQGPGSSSKCFQHLTRVHGLKGLSERVTFRRSRVSATRGLPVRLHLSLYRHPKSPGTAHPWHCQKWVMQR